MAFPWLRALNTLIGIADIARSRRSRELARTTGDPDQPLDAMERLGARPGMEARLAGVMVAALKEVFDRDNRRLELERAQVEAERERAERALKLELLRQRADREIGRMRLLSAVGVVGWLGTLNYASRMVESYTRAMFGAGWLLLLVAVATAFIAQARIAAAVDRAKNDVDDRDVEWSTAPGLVALCVTVVGLALLGLAILL
jgi:hypothetical protein